MDKIDMGDMINMSKQNIIIKIKYFIKGVYCSISGDTYEEVFLQYEKIKKNCKLFNIKIISPRIHIIQDYRENIDKKSKFPNI